MSGGGGGGGGGIGGVSGPEGTGGVGGGPSYDMGTGASDYNPNRTGQEVARANVMKKANEEEQKKRDKLAKEAAAAAALEKAKKDKKEADRRNRSLLTGYTDPNVARRRLLRAPDGGTIGEDTSTQLI